MLSYSDDYGVTWSLPRKAISDSTSSDFNPRVAVNKKGVVGISWYSSDGVGENPLASDYCFAASLDGGDTFSPSISVSRGSMSAGSDVMLKQFQLPGANSNTSRFVSLSRVPTGHTAGLTVDAAGRFHPLWIDARSGIPQIWTSALTVRAKAAHFGADRLANLEDVSNQVSVVFENVRYDSSAQMLTAEVALINNSTSSLSEDLLLRVLNTESRHGGSKLQATNSDNKLVGPGAIWSFAEAIPQVGLEQGQSSEAIEVKFRVLQQDQAGVSIELPVELTVQVLAKAR